MNKRRDGLQRTSLIEVGIKKVLNAIEISRQKAGHRVFAGLTHTSSV